MEPRALRKLSTYSIELHPSRVFSCCCHEYFLDHRHLLSGLVLDPPWSRRTGSWERGSWWSQGLDLEATGNGYAMVLVSLTHPVLLSHGVESKERLLGRLWPTSVA